MYPTKPKPPFENRYDAGRKLAYKLIEYLDRPIVVLAIPNGGVPLGMEVALGLKGNLDLMVSRKIPVPFSPESGLGAVADDGSIILNDELVARLGLTREQIDSQVNQVRVEIKRRRLLYREDRPPVLVSGKTVIITDDGLASGFTMLATISSLRSRRPKEIVVAVPVSSVAALDQVNKVADKVITLFTGSQSKFAVADYYRSWHDVTDEEVFKCLNEVRQKRFKKHNG